LSSTHHIESREIEPNVLSQILQFAFWMRKTRYRNSTVQTCVRALKGLARRTNLLGTGSVKSYLATAKVSDQGKAAAYVATQESPDEIRHAMQAFGIDVGRLEGSGALHVFPYKDLYFKGGRFSIPNVMGLWKTLYEDVTAKGFKGLRAAGEMACFFKEKAIKELVECERALGRTFEMPLEGICAYDANDLAEKGGLYLDLIKAHRSVIITGLAGGVVSSY
jgi:hypothetical protein